MSEQFPMPGGAPPSMKTAMASGLLASDTGLVVAARGSFDGLRMSGSVSQWPITFEDELGGAGEVDVARAVPLYG